ncbi:hypothetical protein [Candidatus Bodocaedibacter vickermanii]|uniref:Uncharacterized protein n=1 Tax=Candidatus Bodocaedibacter vickermanii TaxID=2741701 RepID=A0A7L9RVM8_9PROT|nr:hypothetical protein CPBP_01202 [Candidatus Paracaedibacteraceae bacterium 'Lake Konstanz']
MYKRLSLGAVLCHLMTLVFIESYARDTFVGAGRADPQSAAVCYLSKISQALNGENENIATGFWTDINGTIGG